MGSKTLIPITYKLSTIPRIKNSWTLKLIYEHFPLGELKKPPPLWQIGLISPAHKSCEFLLVFQDQLMKFSSIDGSTVSWVSPSFYIYIPQILNAKSLKFLINFSTIYLLFQQFMFGHLFIDFKQKTIILFVYLGLWWLKYSFWSFSTFDNIRISGYEDYWRSKWSMNSQQRP